MNTKSTIVITILNTTGFRSSMIKSILIVSNLIFGIERKYSKDILLFWTPNLSGLAIYDIEKRIGYVQEAINKSIVKVGEF